jgi:molybdenum cofactor guanylyltransferase
MKMAIVILAGGPGRRIGGNKPLRLLGGQRLVDRAIAFAAARATHIALSVGHADQLSDLPIERIVDAQPDWGPLAGIASAFAFAARGNADVLLSVPCDSPFLPDDLATRLGAALQPGIGVAVPMSGGTLHVACGLWRVSVRDTLAAYAATGGRSLHGLVERVGFAPVTWPAEPVDPFFNVNSAEDLARAEEMLRREN